MKSPKKNVAESVRARLLNLSKERGDEFHLTLADYVIERFLFRLGQSPLRDRFVLKGAVPIPSLDGAIPSSHQGS